IGNELEPDVVQLYLRRDQRAGIIETGEIKCPKRAAVVADHGRGAGQDLGEGRTVVGDEVNLALDDLDGAERAAVMADQGPAVMADQVGNLLAAQRYAVAVDDLHFIRGVEADRAHDHEREGATGATRGVEPGGDREGIVAGYANAIAERGKSLVW